MMIYRKTLVAGMLMLLAQTGFAHGWQAAAMWDWVLTTANPTLADHQAQLDSLQSQIDAQEQQITALNSYISDLQSYVEVDTSAPSVPVVRVNGANFQVVNGTGDTEQPNGVGNLIVGYDESRGAQGPFVCTLGSILDETACLNGGHTWAQSFKSGSHNLVIGNYHNYSQTGGVVTGWLNTINNSRAVALAGSANSSSHIDAVTVGGLQNHATKGGAVVVGGSGNEAGGNNAVVSGGSNNTASGQYSSVSGGNGNIASGDYSSVSGGSGRSAAGNSNWAAGSLFETQ